MGNLIGQRDGRSQWLYLEYDDLNRLIRKRRDTAGSGPLVAEYGYDAVGQKGLLSFSKAYNSASSTVEVEMQAVTYDARNRLTQQRWVVNGVGTFRMDYALNEADQRTSLTYPGGTAAQQGEVVSYSYNAIGQLAGVSGSGLQYVSSATYNAQGQLTEMRNDTGGNGLTRQFVYETNTLRLNTIKAGVSSPYENLQKLTYAHDNAGNVTSLIDIVNSSQKQCFQYDWLNRLTGAFTGDSGCTAYSATGTGPYNHTYAYDAIGNITSYAGNSYTYGDTAHKHAVTAAFGNTYGYDANGNQTTRTVGGTPYTFTFDYENRLTTISGGSVSASFGYDADGNRVKGTVGGVTTVYLAGSYEYQGGATTQYYEGNAFRRTGYTSDNGVFYLLQDHLKSSSALVNQNGTLNASQYYYPFGGNRGATFSTLTTKRFTGQYHESSLPGGEGLSYYNARWYDAKLGRFLSADSIVPGPSNPQAFNRYSYGLNNPSNRIDPSGHCSMNVGGMMMHFAPGGCGGSGNPTSFTYGGKPSSASVVTCAGLGCAGRGQQAPHHHAYLPVIRNQAGYRPAAYSACPGSLVCRPLPTPTATPPALQPWWVPLPTRPAQLVAGPTLTPTPTVGPTATPVPLGSPNITDWYWSLAGPVAETAAEELGIPTVIRAGGRFIGTIPSIPTTVVIGLGASVGPNLVSNLRAGNGAPSIISDLAVDTVGYGISAAGGLGAGLVGGAVGFGVGDFIGSTGTSTGWDLFVAPRFRAWIMSTFFGE